MIHLSSMLSQAAVTLAADNADADKHTAAKKSVDTEAGEAEAIDISTLAQVDDESIDATGEAEATSGASEVPSSGH